MASGHSQSDTRSSAQQSIIPHGSWLSEGETSLSSLRCIPQGVKDMPRPCSHPSVPHLFPHPLPHPFPPGRHRGDAARSRAQEGGRRREAERKEPSPDVQAICAWS